MATVTVWKDTKKRCNPFTAYTDVDGTRHMRVPAGLYEHAPAADPPVDFNYDTHTVREIDDAPYFVYARRPDEEIAATRWEKLKQLRDEKIGGGVKVGDKWFHSDVHSKVQQLSLMLAGANLPAGIQWKTMDGSFVGMTPELAAQIYHAQMAQEQSIFLVAETKRVDDTDARSGWPEVYTDTLPNKLAV